MRGALGVTLVELLVVLAVLGAILSVTGLAVGSLRMPRESEFISELRKARADAIRTGVPRTMEHARFLPDGRVIGPGLDPLTGEPGAK